MPPAKARRAAEAPPIALFSAAFWLNTTALTRRVPAPIPPAENQEPPHKPLNLFFYYQHHHHPHAFKSDAEKNESKKRSVDSIDKIYAYFCQDEEREKIKTRRFGLLILFSLQKSSNYINEQREPTVMSSEFA